MKTDSRNRFLAACEKFLSVVNGILIVAIGVVIICTLGLLFSDVFSFVQDRTAHGIGVVLSSLLILWVLMELLENQVGFLKGKRLDVGVFVLVAIVAFVRKLMVASLKTDKLELAVYPLVAVLALSVAYFLIEKSESRGKKDT